MKRENKRRYIVSYQSTEQLFYNEQIAKAFTETTNGHLIEIIN